MNNKHEVIQAYKTILDALGFHGDHIEGTPERVARMWENFTNPPSFISTTFTAKEKTGYIIMKDHQCYSFCPHHLLPVKYNIKLGYLPSDNIILGLSKLARICDDQMRHMPVQEDLGGMVARQVIQSVNPQGVGVVIQGEHMCMQMRGVESHCASATTTFMWGVLLTDQSAREEVLLL